MPAKLKRRRFLASALGGLGLLIVSPRTAFAYPANEQLNIAVVGMRGYAAWYGMALAIHGYDNVAYAFSCDVDERKYRQVYQVWDERAREWPESDDADRRRAANVYARLAQNHPPLYADFRKMLDEQYNRIDGVLCATPDHSHTVIAATALRAGKPAFVEKPMSISGHEARALRMLARQSRLATGANTRGAAMPGFRRGLEVMRQGLIGPVEQVHMWFQRGRGGQNFQEAPAGPEEIPPELNWNKWLAQLSYREYHRRWINRIAWRGTSMGELGNMGPHVGNLAFMGLNIADLWDGQPGENPIRVTAEVSEINRISYPTWEKIHWEVPARGQMPPVNFHWHHGPGQTGPPGSRERIRTIMRELGASEQEQRAPDRQRHALIVGSKGAILTSPNNHAFELVPDAKYHDVPQDGPTGLVPNAPVGPSDRSYPEWFAAIRGDGPMPLTNFHYHGAYHEFLALGSVAHPVPQGNAGVRPRDREDHQSCRGQRGDEL